MEMPPKMPLDVTGAEQVQTQKKKQGNWENTVTKCKNDTGYSIPTIQQT